MDPITKDFIARMEKFAKQESIPMATFSKGPRKDDVAAPYRKKFALRKESGSSAKRGRRRRCSAPNGGAMSGREPLIHGWSVPPPWSITFTSTAWIGTAAPFS